MYPNLSRQEVKIHSTLRRECGRDRDRHKVRIKDFLRANRTDKVGEQRERRDRRDRNVHGYMSVACS